MKTQPNPTKNASATAEDRAYFANPKYPNDNGWQDWASYKRAKTAIANAEKGVKSETSSRFVD